MFANIDVGCSPSEWEFLLNALKKVYVLKSKLSGDENLPQLYLSGIKYKRERGERWQNPHETYTKRAGDCEDLALYRAVELCKRGIDASIRIYRTGSGSYHAIVEIHPDIYEDPSRLLGMNSNSPFMGEEYGQSMFPGLPGSLPGLPGQSMFPGLPIGQPMFPGLPGQFLPMAASFIPGGQAAMMAAQYGLPASQAFKKWLRKKKRNKKVKS